MKPEGGEDEKQISLANRVRYLLNTLLLRNPFWQIMVLVCVSAVIVLIGMLLVEDLTSNSFWWSFTRLVDQGTFINDNYDPQVAAVGVAVTVGGILILSLLIGIFSSKINEKLDSLKRGKSPVIEKGHFVVCGSGDRLFEVTRELIRASEQDSIHGRIVMFSRLSREEMEEKVEQRLGRRKVRKVICRSGSTTDVDALQIACFSRCRGFVVVGDDDGRILKTLVGIDAIREANRPVGVCELRNRRRHRIAQMAYSGIHWIPVREIVMRLIVQVCRQPGLSSVYNEILSFAGNEFYLKGFPEMEGLAFGEISGRIRGGVAVGMQSGEEMLLNPPAGKVLEKDSRLLILTRDSESCSFIESCEINEETVQRRGESCRKPLKMLILSGGSRQFCFMLGLLDRYAMEGGKITVAGSLTAEEGEGLLSRAALSNCGIEYIRVDRTDPEQMEALSPETYDSVMVISGKTEGMTDEDADSECLVTLLILRHLKEKLKSDWEATVVSEIRNPRNRRLASTAGIDDFVISNEVCSMIMAQLVLEPDMGMVYEEIFDPRGCEIQLRCRESYSAGDFGGLVRECLSRREVALGWLEGSASDCSVCLNPKRSARVPEGGDTRVVVIAER